MSGGAEHGLQWGREQRPFHYFSDMHRERDQDKDREEEREKTERLRGGRRRGEKEEKRRKGGSDKP